MVGVFANPEQLTGSNINYVLGMILSYILHSHSARTGYMYLVQAG